jgi:hypothetical protein
VKTTLAYLLIWATAVINCAAQREPEPRERYQYAAQTFITSWNRWERLETPAVGDNSLFIADNTERYDSGQVWELWMVDYGRQHGEFYGWRKYNTLDVWYDMSLSIPLQRRIEMRDGVVVYDLSPSHFPFASMDIRQEVSAFSGSDGWGGKYWRATRCKVGIVMNGLRSVKYRLHVGLLWAHSVPGKSEHSEGVQVPWRRVYIGGEQCDEYGGVWLEIPGGGLVTDITPDIPGEDYFRWGNFYTGEIKPVTVVIPPRRRFAP